jgi:CrcB protein
MTMVLVAMAGGIGCLVRYGIELAVRHRHPRQRPWGTVGANALGCFVAGFVVYGLTNLTPEWRSVLTSGFCGGLTTFSSFSAEAVELLSDRDFLWSFVLVASHLVGSLAMTYLGILTMRSFNA